MGVLKIKTENGFERIGGGVGDIIQSGNGINPYANDNEEIDIPDFSQNANGLNDTARVLLINILRNAVYTSDQSAMITALEKALVSNGGGETPDVLDVLDVTGGDTVIVTSYSNNPSATTGNVKFRTDPFSFYNAKSIKIINRGTQSFDYINVVFETSSESYPTISRTQTLTFDGNVAILDPTTILNFNIANGNAFLEVSAWFTADILYDAEITY